VRPRHQQDEPDGREVAKLRRDADRQMDVDAREHDVAGQAVEDPTDLRVLAGEAHELAVRGVERLRGDGQRDPPGGGDPASIQEAVSGEIPRSPPMAVTAFGVRPRRPAASAIR
jgi:hypothetical protein